MSVAKSASAWTSRQHGASRILTTSASEKERSAARIKSTTDTCPSALQPSACIMHVKIFSDACEKEISVEYRCGSSDLSKMTHLNGKKIHHFTNIRWVNKTLRTECFVQLWGICSHSEDRAIPSCALPCGIRPFS